MPDPVRSQSEKREADIRNKGPAVPLQGKHDALPLERVERIQQAHRYLVQLHCNNRGAGEIVAQRGE